jgi:hypothetical protein
MGPKTKRQNAVIFGNSVQTFAVLDGIHKGLVAWRFIYRQEIKGVGADWRRAGGIETWQLKCPNPRHYEHFGIYSYI